MKIGDFAIVKYDMGDTSSLYSPEIRGRLGRVKDATYTTKLSGGRQVSEVELLLVSDEKYLYPQRFPGTQLKVFGNTPATLENVKAYFDGLKSRKKQPLLLQRNITRLENDLERALNDYELLVTADLKATYSDDKVTELFLKKLEIPVSPSTLYFPPRRRPHFHPLDLGPIN